MLMMLGPGSTCDSDISSRNCSFDIQRLSSTSVRCATGSTPPKPFMASAVKAVNRTIGDSGRSCGKGSDIRPQRSTFRASGLTSPVGFLAMKLTTLSKAAPK